VKNCMGIGKLVIAYPEQKKCPKKKCDKKGPENDQGLESFEEEVVRHTGYLMSVTSLNMGMYIETTIKPTAPPRNTISRGSIIAVRFATALSTSSS